MRHIRKRPTGGKFQGQSRANIFFRALLSAFIFI